MKKIIRNSIIFICSLSLFGCTDWLDIRPTNKFSNQIVWTDQEYVESYVNFFYQYIWEFGPFHSGDSEVAIVDGLTETFKYNSPVKGTNIGNANEVVLTRVMNDAPSAAFYLGRWDGLYEHIRRVNQFLKSLELYSTFDEELTARFEAEGRFFRGMLYFELVKRSKDVILHTDTDKYDVNTPVSTEEEGWDLVYEDLMFAAANLPDRWEATMVGKVTSGAAYAMLSRAMLYAERWQEAKDAADALINSNVYSLMPGTTWREYQKAYMTTSLEGNTESILEYAFSEPNPSHTFDRDFSSRADGGTASGYGRAVPTQEMVESYEYATGGFPDWSPWHTESGTTQTPPWIQLEPRFHAHILYNGVYWRGRNMETYVGGDDGWVEYVRSETFDGRSTTGYFLRKFLDEDKRDFSGDTKSTTPWIKLRLAEVYLNRAEAAYRLGEEATSLTDLNRIRERVGLPALTGISGQELFNAIRQERKIEFAFEIQLYWDMRRWRLAHTEYNGMRVHGLKITKNNDGTYLYQYVDCDKEDRFFPEKLYRLPIPATEISYNKSVDQYPEWR